VCCRRRAGVKFQISAELDHPNKNYRFGFGINLGE